MRLQKKRRSASNEEDVAAPAAQRAPSASALPKQDEPPPKENQPPEQKQVGSRSPTVLVQLRAQAVRHHKPSASMCNLSCLGTSCAVHTTASNLAHRMLCCRRGQLVQAAAQRPQQLYQPCQRQYRRWPVLEVF